ncbi:MAG: type II secretion system F family protein [Patescibacteria group bacterium]
MPIFKYTAKNELGEPIKGKVEASSQSQAAAVLGERHLLVISVKPLGEESFLGLKSILGGIKHGDLVNFTRQLATMINAGLPLATALSILEEQSTTEMGRLIGNLLKEIEGGGTFSTALEKANGTFSRVYIQLVRAGEVGGMLDGVLQRLADTMEKDKEFREKTKGALIYPVIIVLAMVAVAFVMMVFVVPQLTAMYKDFGADLPLPTQILISVSNVMSTYWYVFIGLGVLGFSALRSWKKTEVGDRIIDGWLGKVPIYGSVRTKIILTEFSRTLALLLGAGVSLLEALEVVGEAMTSVTYREAIKESAKRVEKGVALSQAIARHEIFPSILNQMVAVGEETGKLTDILLKLSAYFESESEHAIKNLTTALEPMIMIVLGVGVGMIVIAIIMPIYNLTSQF